METVYNIDKLVDYPAGAIVNLCCPEYRGFVRIKASEYIRSAPCDICALRKAKFPCYELCCVEFRKDHSGVFFEPILIRQLKVLDVLAACAIFEPVQVSTKCFEGYVRAQPCFDVFNSCKDCAFNSPFTPCPPCTASQRKDGEEVYFEKI